MRAIIIPTELNSGFVTQREMRLMEWVLDNRTRPQGVKAVLDGLKVRPIGMREGRKVMRAISGTGA